MPAWEIGGSIPFELQMPQSSSIPFQEALTKYYQGKFAAVLMKEVKQAPKYWPVLLKIYCKN